MQTLDIKIIYHSKEQLTLPRTFSLVLIPTHDKELTKKNNSANLQSKMGY